MDFVIPVVIIIMPVGTLLNDTFELHSSILISTVE